MGRSAKVHKRTPKKAVAPANGATTKPGTLNTNAVDAAKRKSGLKAKAGSKRAQGDGPVLGGADYVTIAMGGRRKAREEAKKLPPPER